MASPPPPGSDFRKVLERAFGRISAGADLQVEVTLTPEECEALVKWIRSERYRHRPRKRS